MKKFKFAALALVGVGALGCSGHKITMKPIEKVEDARARFEKVMDHEFTEKEIPDNFAFSFLVSEKANGTLKDNQSASFSGEETQSQKLYLDRANARFKITETRVQKVKANDVEQNTNITNELYMFVDNGKVYGAQKMYGYCQALEMKDVTVEQFKEEIAIRAIEMFGLDEIYGVVYEMIDMFISADEDIDDLEDPYFIDNKYGSDDEKSFQMVSKSKMPGAPSNEEEEKYEVFTDTDAFCTIKDYLIRDCDLVMTSNVDYEYTPKKHNEVQSTGLVVKGEMTMKGETRFEEGKGSFSLPEYTVLEIPEAEIGFIEE